MDHGKTYLGYTVLLKENYKGKRKPNSRKDIYIYIKYEKSTTVRRLLRMVWMLVLHIEEMVLVNNNNNNIKEKV